MNFPVTTLSTIVISPKTEAKFTDRQGAVFQLI
jgi:hypothetical protein